MTDLRLALRIVRGSGRAGVLRLALMTVGYAFGVMVVIFLAALPAVLAKRGEVTTARQPLSVDTGTQERFAWQLNPGFWRSVRFTRVVVTTAPENAEVSAPPGVARLPRPGEVVLSPAAAALARTDAQFARLVPGRPVGLIGPAGLLGPDELYAYVGVPADEMGTPTPGRGWGGGHADEDVTRQFSGVPRELLLIVTGPAVVYFIVCARLSAATRARRYAALRLVGMSRRRLRRVAVLESAVAAIVGGALGLVAYHLMNALVGPSGALGFTWYPVVSELSTAKAIAAGVVVVTVAALTGGFGAQRALARPLEVRRDNADRPARWWYAGPFVLGIGLVAAPLVLGGSNRRWSMDPVSGGLLLGGVVLSTGGLLLALRPVLVALARRVAGSGAPISARIAARRVEYESAGLAWHLAGLCVLVLVAAVGAGALRQTELSATPDPQRLVVKLTAADVPTGARDRLTDLPASGYALRQRSSTGPVGPGTGPPATVADEIRQLGVILLVADCATLRQLADRPLTGCRDGGLFRVGREGDRSLLPVGQPVPFARADGTQVTMTAPPDRLDLPGFLAGGLTLLITSRQSPLGIPADTSVIYKLPPDIAGIDRFATALTSLAPGATMTVFDLDVEALEAYRVHRGVVGVGILLAFALGLAAFIISALGRAVERRREVVALVALGVSRRTLRTVQWWQQLTPLTAALLAAALVGHLSGNALLRLQGQQVGWYYGTLAVAWPMMAAGLLAAGVLGGFVFGLRPRAEELRRE